MSNSTLTPKLRFSEFLDDWIDAELDDIADIVGERVSLVDLELEHYVSTENILPDFGGITSASNLPSTGSVTRFRTNDVLVSNIRPYLKKVWVADRDGGASNDVIVIRAKPVIRNSYLACVLRSESFIAHVMKGAKGVKMPRGDIGLMMEYPVAYPMHEEQEKIANCLLSLDELIAAEERKLESQQVYKKGLMQQLFPRDGETTPRLRFPEFYNAGEWKVIPLAEVGTNLDNRRVPIAEVSRTKGEIPYYGASGIVDYVKDFIFDEDLLCVSEDGANLVARTYPIAFSISGKTWVNNHAHVLRFDNSHTQKIVEDYLNSIDLQDFITGMAQPKLNRAMLDTIPIPLPPEDEERVKVAGCLLSLDAQIATQSQSLAALRTHKKGLMQQLFPSSAEGEV